MTDGQIRMGSKSGKGLTIRELVHVELNMLPRYSYVLQDSKYFLKQDHLSTALTIELCFAIQKK